jgi:hypothetical protein
MHRSGLPLLRKHAVKHSLLLAADTKCIGGKLESQSFNKRPDQTESENFDASILPSGFFLNNGNNDIINFSVIVSLSRNSTNTMMTNRENLSTTRPQTEYRRMSNVAQSPPAIK